MGNLITKCLEGKTDLNQNNIPDNREVQLLIESYVAKQKEKRNKALVKKILRKT